jgi:8-oxo-dGTP diphosphatase
MSIPAGIKRVAVLCILQHQQQYLLLERLKAPNAGMYTPVGGKIDPFETPDQAAIREVFEETGLTVNEVHFCGILTETSPTNYNWVSYVFKAAIHWQPAPACNEGTLHWVHETHVANIPTPTTDAHIYKYVQQQQPFILDAVYDDQLNLITFRELIHGTNLC